MARERPLNITLFEWILGVSAVVAAGLVLAWWTNNPPPQIYRFSGGYVGSNTQSSCGCGK